MNQFRKTKNALIRLAVPFVFGMLLLSAPLTALRADERIYKGTEEGLIPPKPVKRVRAEYDESAKARHIKGVVKLNMIISRDGKPQNVTVFESLDPELDAKAIAAAKQWLWEPARFENKPVSCEVRLEIGFAP